MLPNQTVPEGSRKVLNGVEVYTRHNFTTEQGNFFETMDGNYILPNGEPVKDKSLLESLPDPQRQKALAWWDQRFGGPEFEEEVLPPDHPAPPAAGKKMTKAELLAEIRSLQAQAEAMEDEAPEPVEKTEAVTGKAEQPKDNKASKRTGRPKTEKEPSVLSQMGIMG
jgi:hypothetical protein